MHSLWLAGQGRRREFPYLVNHPNYNETQTTTSAGGAQLQVRRNGTYEGSPSGQNGDWVTPKDSTVGDLFEIYVQVNSGSITTGNATGTWLSLSSDRFWRCARGSPGTISANITISIRRADTGEVVDTSTHVLTHNYP